MGGGDRMADDGLANLKRNCDLTIRPMLKGSPYHG
jgi:hypothetical protein